MDLTALRKAIGAADTVPDADVLTQAVAKIGTIPTLESAKTKAEGDLTVALSRTNTAKDPEPFPAAIATGSFNNLAKEVELLAREGHITGEQATAATALLGTADKPNTLMLSRDGANHPAEGWLKVLALGKSGIDADGKQKTDVQEVERKKHDHSDTTNLSRDGEPDYAAIAAKAAGEFVAASYPTPAK